MPPGPQTSMPRSARRSAARQRSASSSAAGAKRRPRRAPWIQECGGRAPLSFLHLPRRQLLLERPHVRKRELADLDQVRHDRGSRAAEKFKKIADQAPMNNLPCELRLEDVRVSNLLHAPHRTFLLEAVDHGLNGCVGGP